MATEGGAEGGDGLTPERGGGSPGAPPGSAAAESALLSEAEAWLTQADGVGQSAGEGPSLHSVAKLKVREGRRRGATSPKLGRALRDFPADTEGDLELRTGDRVVVTKSNPSRHWWSGHIEGDTERSGSFPKDFIEILGDAPAPAAAAEPPAPEPAPAPAPATTPVRQHVSLSARTPQPEPEPGRAFSLPDLEPEPEPQPEAQPEPEVEPAPAPRRQPPPPPPEAASPTEAASPPSASPLPPVTPQPRPASFNLDDVEDITPMLTSPRCAPHPLPPLQASLKSIMLCAGSCGGRSRRRRSPNASAQAWLRMTCS